MTDPIHTINNLNTQVGIANANAVDSEVRKNAQIREQQQEIDRLRSNPSRRSLSGAARAQLANTNAELAEKDALLLDWMHGQEAFKRLAKSFGTKLGLSQAEMQKAADEMIIDVADENPKYSDTSILKGAMGRKNQEISK